MNNNNKMKSKKRIMITFVLILAGSLFAGILVGRFGFFAENHGITMWITAWGAEALLYGVPVVLVASCLLGILVSLITYAGCRSMYKRYKKEEENEELLDRLEDKLNTPLIFANAGSLFHTGLFLCVMLQCMTEKFEQTIGAQYVPVFLIAYIAAMVVEMAVMQAVVKIEKELNPEKQGDFFDTGFRKVWMNSCDEAQKQMVYQAGYHAFLTTNVTCMVLMIVSFIISFLFKTDIWAVAAVSLICFTNTLSYMLYAAKLERRR